MTTSLHVTSEEFLYDIDMNVLFNGIFQRSFDEILVTFCFLTDIFTGCTELTAQMPDYLLALLHSFVV